MEEENFTNVNKTGLLALKSPKGSKVPAEEEVEETIGGNWGGKQMSQKTRRDGRNTGLMTVNIGEGSNRF